MLAHRPALALPLLAASVLCLFGCSNTPSKPKQQQPPPLDLSSPAATLAALRTAYMARDSVTYAKLFEEDFVFVFCPGGLTPLPFDYWHVQDEVLAARHMFSDANVDTITLSFELSDTIPSGDVVPGSCKIVMDQIHLSVFTSVDNIPYEYRVNGSHGMFYFRSSAGEDGRRIWRIARWEDQPLMAGALLKAGKETNWGLIKFLYYQGDERQAHDIMFHYPEVDRSTLSFTPELPVPSDDRLRGQPCGGQVWRIYTWFDEPAPTPHKSGDVTWGRVKSEYR